MYFSRVRMGEPVPGKGGKVAVIRHWYLFSYKFVTILTDCFKGRKICEKKAT